MMSLSESEEYDLKDFLRKNLEVKLKVTDDYIHRNGWELTIEILIDGHLIDSDKIKIEHFV